ncbi:MAG: sensor histidine kinase [Flavobacteriaceae bacterium]|nr:MAG: sensor histidine kinase [Flavobacteriaceae bacterium]
MSQDRKLAQMEQIKFSEIKRRHHFIFWSIYFIINVLRWGSYFDDYDYSLKTNLIGFPIHMLLCYINIYILMPSFVFKRKYFLYLISVLGVLFLMVLLKFNLTYFLVSNDVWPEGPEITRKFTINYTIQMMIGELYVVTFVTAIKITMDWIQEHQRSTQLAKVQLETELLFLRSQISPHFFFNTLNNIYSLAIEKSDKTAKIILKLSEFMRYLLHETKNSSQTLDKEIMCIQNYLDLERIRFDERLEINMELSGELMDKSIPPMILLAFVENAFKHGANKNIGKIKIDIYITVKEDFLYFRIENPMPAKTIYEQRFNTKSGLGLKNVKKRLELGYKKNEYEVKTGETDGLFIATLKIKIR